MGPAPAWSPPTPWGWPWPSVPSMASGAPQTTLFAVWWWPWAGVRHGHRLQPQWPGTAAGPDHPGGRGRPAGDPAPDPSPAGGDELRDPYLSAAEEALIGGDFYDAAFTPHGLRLIVGDVRGKGLPAVQLAS